MKHNGGVSRISVSLPEPLLNQLDEMVGARGYESRSAAITEMISHQVIAHKRELGNAGRLGIVEIQVPAHDGIVEDGAEARIPERVLECKFPPVQLAASLVDRHRDIEADGRVFPRNTEDVAGIVATRILAGDLNRAGVRMGEDIVADRCGVCVTAER